MTKTAYREIKGISFAKTTVTEQKYRILSLWRI